MYNLKKRKNGTGSAVFLGKGRYKPWAARITVGKKIDGKPVYMDIDNFETQLDALVCLENYHKEPTPLKIKKEKYEKIAFFSKNNYPLVPVENITADIHRENKKNYTFKRVFEEMKESIFPTKEEMKMEKELHIRAKDKLGHSTTSHLYTAFNHSDELHDKLYRELRTSDFKKCIKSQKITPSTKELLLKLYRYMDSYAFSEDIIDKKYADEIKSETIQRKPKIPFTYEQIDKLWKIKPDKSSMQFVRDFLILSIYTGCRAEELLFLYTKNIFLQENYFITGLKTQAGKNRTIPIHNLIKPIIKKYYKKSNEFLFEKDTGKRITYSMYANYFSTFVKKYPEFSKNTTHCGRHTLETELQRLNIKSTIINSILGHKNGNVADDVYNHISIAEKIEAINMIKYKETKIHILNPIKKDEKRTDKTS